MKKIIICLLMFGLISIYSVSALTDTLSLGEQKDYTIGDHVYEVRFGTLNTGDPPTCSLRINGGAEDPNGDYATQSSGETFYSTQIPLAITFIDCDINLRELRFRLTYNSLEPVCGNGDCESGETCSSCSSDCGVCPPVCGNGICEDGEVNSCHADCDWCGDGDCNAGETCSTCSQDCDSCCGNGRRDSGENCRICPQDVSCGSNQVCSTSGECINLGTNANCASLGDRCSSNEECINRQCKSKCGNGRKDSGENCANCPQDARCSSNQACSTSGQCIQLGSTQNCAFIGDSCGSGFCDNNKCVECRTTSDCASKKGKESTGKYECSADRRGRYEILVEKGGQCINGKCSGSDEIKNTFLDSCGENPCYNGKCGCPEGYGTCEETWNCVKRETILVGQTCDCNVQCESGFCKNQKCVKPIDVTLSSTKATLKPGEESIVTLTISSNLNDDVSGSATLKIGSGTEIVDIRSTVSECTGNICKISGTLAGRDTQEITVTLKSNSEVTIPISADVSYKVEGQDVQISKSKSIAFTEAKKITPVTGMSIAELTSNVPKGYLIGGIIVVIIIIFLIVYFIGKSHGRK